MPTSYGKQARREPDPWAKEGTNASDKMGKINAIIEKGLEVIVVGLVKVCFK